MLLVNIKNLIKKILINGMIEGILIILLLLVNDIPIKYKLLLVIICIIFYYLLRKKKTILNKNSIPNKITVALDNIEKMLIYKGKNIKYQQISKNQLEIYNKIIQNVNNFYKKYNDVIYNYKKFSKSKSQKLPLNLDPMSQFLGVIITPKDYEIKLFNETLFKLKEYYDKIITDLYNLEMYSKNSLNDYNILNSSIKIIRFELKNSMLVGNIRRIQEDRHYKNMSGITSRSTVNYVNDYLNESKYSTRESKLVDDKQNYFHTKIIDNL